MRPDSLHVGGTVYWVLQTYNPDTGVLKDADSTPAVAVRKNGAAVGDSVTVTKRSATTGIYDCSYNPAGEVEGDKFTIEESATVTGTTTSSATYSQTWGLVVLAVERGTDSAATAANMTVALDGLGYLMAAEIGACADAGTATETYAITINGSTYTIDHTGLDATGNRGTATLTKT
jgi:microcompartment protein CcmK/EutM